MNHFLIALAVSTMSTVGQLLVAKDSNSTGADDVAGTLLISGSQALAAFTQSNEKGFRHALTIIRDTVNAYLATTSTT